MPTVYRLNYQPDLDRNWANSPGCCTAMAGLAPLQDGSVGTVLKVGGASMYYTGDNVLHGQMFMQTDGTVRLLAFRTNDIDEYTSGGVRTNRATGLTTAADWSAAAWGNQIIAVSKANATQSSTGAGFSALGGSSPKAAYIAANANFVMMADVDDGGSNVYTDMVWWCGIRNTATWTPSQATQAGRIRLLDAPGPIKQIWSYGKDFLVFKENAIFIGRYVGPPYVFAWQLLTADVGCSFPKSVTECDGRVYFAHRSGFYSLDSNGVQNIGRGVAISEAYSASVGVPLRAVGDEQQGVVWFFQYTKTVGGGTYYQLSPFGYNVRTGLWAKIGALGQTTSTAYPPAVVQATYAERATFNSSAIGQGSFTYFANDNTSTTSRYASVEYPDGLSDLTASFTTGYVGSNDAASTLTRAHLRFARNSFINTVAISSASFDGYSDETGSTADTTKTATWNTEMQTLDATLNAKYKTLSVTFTASSNQFTLAGVGFDLTRAGSR